MSVVTLSCVVPAYNEAANLPAFLPALHAKLSSLADSVEIVVVNDGSRDDTALVLAEMSTRLPLRVIHLSRNFGKEAALSAGLDHVDGDAVLLIDADFQHPLALIDTLFAAWRAGHEMVYAVRTSREEESLVKRMGTKLLYRILSGDGAVDIPPNAGDFRLMDRRVVQALRQLPERNRFMKGLYAWVGFRSLAVPYQPDERAGGASSFSFSALVRLASSGIMSFSDMPLRIWIGVGLLISALAFLFGAWIIFETLIEGVTVPGYATIVASMMFLAGVQLISIGVLGAYVASVFNEVKARPLYIVGQVVDTTARAGGSA